MFILQSYVQWTNTFETRVNYKHSNLGKKSGMSFTEFCITQLLVARPPKGEVKLLQVGIAAFRSTPKSQKPAWYLTVTMSTVVLCPWAAVRLHFTLVVKTRRQFLCSSSSTARHRLLQVRELHSQQWSIGLPFLQAINLFVNNNKQGPEQQKRHNVDWTSEKEDLL